MKNYNTDLWSVVLAVALVLTLAVILMTTKREKPAEVSFSAEEIELIVSADSTMRVLDARDSADLAVLRKISSELTDEDLDSGLYEKLCSLMIATVTSDDNDGVGIAAPQTGICKRLVAVQRFDKENHPFEIYPNIRIIGTGEEQTVSTEGCLSVPDMKGDVLRYSSIRISYTDHASREKVEETVEGFTAVIFQHETDHLEGILYTDKIIGDDLSDKQ